MARLSSSQLYVPNPIIVDRAVEVWKQLLGAPKYDNLGPNSPESVTSKAQNLWCSGIAASLPKNNTPEVLDRFGEELKKILLEKQVSKFDPKYSNYVNSLDVDYHPCEHLALAAERSGLKMEFPWKTRMWIWSDNLHVSNGYGDEARYHYPLNNGGWLVTTLYGSDISKIIKLVEDGYLTTELESTPGYGSARA